MITESILRAKVAHKVHTFKTQREAALWYEVSPQYLHDVLAGLRGIGDAIASKHGYRLTKERHYDKIEEK